MSAKSPQPKKKELKASYLARKEAERTLNGKPKSQKERIHHTIRQSMIGNMLRRAHPEFKFSKEFKTVYRKLLINEVSLFLQKGYLITEVRDRKTLTRLDLEMVEMLDNVYVKPITEKPIVQKKEFTSMLN